MRAETKGREARTQTYPFIINLGSMRSHSSSFLLKHLELSSLIPNLEVQGTDNKLTGLVSSILGQTLDEALELSLNIANLSIV